MIAPRRALGLLVLGAVTLALPASAQEAKDVAERIKVLFLDQGIELGYSGASGDASAIVISGATIKPQGESMTLPIGDISLKDVSEEAGTIRVGTMEMETFEQSQEGIDVSVSGVSVTGLVLPPVGATDAMTVYDGAQIDAVSIKKGDAELFVLNNLNVEVTPPENGSPFGFTGGAERFSADLSQVTDANAKRFIDALGYQTLGGSVEMAGSWNPADGRTVVSQYDVNFNDAGTIGLTLDISGYTMEFQKALRDIQQKLAQSPGQDNSAAGMAMLGLMQQLTLGSASLRFEDDTLTGKVLDYFAKQQGAKPSDIANQTKALLPFALAQLNNPEFAQQVTEATSKFLDDPQSLTINVKPAQPLPFAMVAAGAMTAPQALPQQLGVTVTAND